MTKNVAGMKEKLRRRRWSDAIVRRAADIAREKNVTIRLDPDGSIVVSPIVVPDALAQGPDDSGLKDW